jgi:hypothetical protein
VRRDRRPRPRDHVVEVPRLLEPEAEERADPLAHRRERRLGVVDDRPVRRQQDVGLVRRENRARDVRGSEALGAAVRPLRRRKRPDLALAVDEVAAEREPAAVLLEQVGDRACGVARRRQGVQLEAAVHRGPVLRDAARDPDRARQRELVLAQVVVVLELPLTPVPRRSGDQQRLDRRHPDADPRRGRSRQPLHLVAVVVGDEDVGHALDAELTDAVEDGAAAEVDEHGLVAVHEDVDVAGVAEARHTGGDLLERGCPLHV